MSFLPKSLILLIASCAVAASGFAGVKVGSPFPGLAALKLEGTVPSLAGKVVMVDFWATWCAPCKTSFPAYSRLQTELAGRGFTLVAVSVDTEKAPYEAFIKRFTPAFCTLRDADQSLVAAVEVPTMPTCYLIDSHGVVRFTHSGYHGDETTKALREEIVRLLEEKP